MEDKKRPSLLSRILILLFTTFIIFIAYLFFIGKIKYYETLRITNESEGYIGLSGDVLESSEKLTDILNKLSKTKGIDNQPFNISYLAINENTIYVTVQDPNNEDYFDNYKYNSTDLFGGKWKKQNPAKSIHEKDDIFSYDMIDATQIYKFHEFVQKYIKDEKIDLDDSTIQYYISKEFQLEPTEPEIIFTTYLSGTRKSFSITADSNLKNIEITEY